jgi:hypothetical protein
MSRLGNFLGLPKEFEIKELGRINIYPLKVKDMKLFKQNANTEEQMIMSRDIIKLSLQDEKDITNEEIDALPIETFTAIMEAINEVNGFNKDDTAIRRIKEQAIKVK